jgi:hypothetical protein
MSFKRLEGDDFIVSSDSIQGTVWSNGSPTLTTFFTSSVQSGSNSGKYYLDVYNTASNLSGSLPQFSIAYGNNDGSGSINFNQLVNGKSPSSTVYGQWQNLSIGDENTNFNFGGVTQSEFFVISMERARYKESIALGSMTLVLSASTGPIISLTDNSAYASSVIFNEAGRVYQLISGSSGVRFTGAATTADGYSLLSGSYGWLLPDVGTIILNAKAISGSLAGGGINFTYSGSISATASAINETPSGYLFRAISASLSSGFKLNSQETISSNYVFIRPRSSEFNYSENPSFISGSTGEVIYSSFINSPQTFITTVGLYNDTNELLAVAKLSKPLVKDFTKEALIRVKLDF